MAHFPSTFDARHFTFTLSDFDEETLLAFADEFDTTLPEPFPNPQLPLGDSGAWRIPARFVE